MAKFHVADVVKAVLVSRMFLAINSWAFKILCQIAKCGTGLLGGFKGECPQCGYSITGGRHCNGRNCPRCGGVKRIVWAERLAARLLPTYHFHIVLTVPHCLNEVFREHKREMLDILMESGSLTMDTLSEGAFPGGTPAFISVLHTWTQDLSDHNHLHVLIAGGALVKDKKGLRWMQSREDFLFPVKAISAVFRGIFLKRALELAALRKFTLPKTPKKWHVYCAPPFRSDEVAIKYFARYSNRVALADERILDVDYENQLVTVSYKRDPGEREPTDKSVQQIRVKNRKAFAISFQNFILRFASHILPKGFVKIRYGGLYASHAAKDTVQAAHKLVSEINSSCREPSDKIETRPHRRPCPVCSHPLTISLDFAAATGPP